MRRIPRGYLWAVLDIGFVVFFVYSTWSSWQSPIQLPAEEAARIQTVDERSLGAATLSGAAGAGITGASIILGVIGAIVGLGAKELPSRSRHHFFIGAVLCGISLVAGALNMAAIPQLAWRENVVFSAYPSLMLGLQIYPMVPASIRLVLGILRVIA